MRRVKSVMMLALVALVTSGAVAACSSSSSSAPGPLASELSYFPVNSPLVMSIATAPNGAAAKAAANLKQSLPALTLAESSLFLRLSQLGINYNSEIRPLFGNPITVGVESGGVGGTSTNVLGVWQTRDGSALHTLLHKFAPGFGRLGRIGGTTVYQAGTAVLGVDGPTLMLASSRAVLRAAINRHGSRSGLSQDDYNRALAGLPQNGALEAFGSLGAVLAAPSAANARRVPWVAALRSYAVSLAESPSGVTLQFRLDTTGRPLSPTQLPVSSSSGTPALAGTLPIVFGLDDPSQTASFIESVEQTSSPSNYARFQQRQAQSRLRTGADLSQLIEQLAGDAIVETDGHTTVVRAQLGNPASAKSTLAKLMRQPQLTFNPRDHRLRTAGGLYTLATGKPRPVTIGVAGDQLLLGNGSPSQLLAFAGQPATPAYGMQGAAVFRIDLPALVAKALKRPVPSSARALLSLLGPITGSSAESTSALTGSATFTLR